MLCSVGVKVIMPEKIQLFFGEHVNIRGLAKYGMRRRRADARGAGDDKVWGSGLIRHDVPCLSCHAPV